MHVHLRIRNGDAGLVKGMITYGDGIRREGEAPLATLRSFLSEELSDTVPAVHLLPMFPYTSDDGFAVTDFKEINPELGDWEDIGNLGKQYDLMFDAVINHRPSAGFSSRCAWFRSRRFRG